nr:inactive protein RESTRICTED TEV MOVEMENT 1-like [Ipomoea batatas]GME04407.1 inactive protein RESTRICTED TEV MOVEMENT 1-like [Ipomoea batatas]GME15521.1 inactive protein RESTRICTED TEV MOVEMENT 1-like [Ipomoea batatas]
MQNPVMDLSVLVHDAWPVRVGEGFELKGGGCGIALDYPSEFLTGVHGNHGRSVNLYSSSSIITIMSITFVTNKPTYGPFGRQHKDNCGTPFGFKISGNDSRNWISGFYGTVYGDRLECLGVYVQTASTSQSDDESINSTV